jgi:hypothetical protein
MSWTQDVLRSGRGQVGGDLLPCPSVTDGETDSSQSSIRMTLIVSGIVVHAGQESTYDTSGWEEHVRRVNSLPSNKREQAR